MSQTDDETTAPLIGLAFTRAAAYLAAAGIPQTRENTVKLLDLMRAAALEPDPFGWLIAELPRRFELRSPELPSQTPEIRRGSIGYGADKRQ